MFSGVGSKNRSSSLPVLCAVRYDGIVLIRFIVFKSSSCQLSRFTLQLLHCSVCSSSRRAGTLSPAHVKDRLLHLKINFHWQNPHELLHSLVCVWFSFGAFLLVMTWNVSWWPNLTFTRWKEDIKEVMEQTNSDRDEINTGDCMCSNLSRCFDKFFLLLYSSRSWTTISCGCGDFKTCPENGFMLLHWHKKRAETVNVRSVFPSLIAPTPRLAGCEWRTFCQSVIVEMISAAFTWCISLVAGCHNMDGVIHYSETSSLSVH